MHIKEAYKELHLALASIYEIRESSNIAEMVMEKITGLSKSQRLVKHDQLLNDQQMEEFKNIQDQLLNGRPIQYVLGNTWFQNMLFKVDERALIPRPETEELVEYIKKFYLSHENKDQQPFSMIDIGTGSGCIAISLKNNFPAWEVWALDKSNKAIELAKENAQLLRSKVIFKTSDILSEAKNDSLPAFNMIVSNPPYIPKQESSEMDRHVIEHEPKEALFVTNQDPLQFYKAILEFSSHHLLRGGMLFLETHMNYAQEVKNLMEENEFENVQIKKDMQGKDRMLWGKRMGASL